MSKTHFRKCWHCDNVDLHDDSNIPAVRCTRCLSADTRRFRRRDLDAAEVAAPGATLDLNWLFINHASVREAIKRGATPQEVILLLAGECKELRKQLVDIQDDREHFRGIQ